MPNQVEKAKEVEKVKRDRRYIPFENKRPRERKACPKCDSLNVKKRRSTYDYICGRCGWVGQGIKIVEH